jgi:hypothetical protein
MRRSIPLLLLLTFGIASSAAAQEVRKVNQTYFAGDLRRVEVDLAIASLRIEGIEGTNVEVELSLECNRQSATKCAQRAAEVQIHPRQTQDKLRIDLRNTPSGRLGGIKASMVVRMPKRLDLEVDFTGGDVTAIGLLGNIEIDTGTGAVDLTYEQDLVARVKVALGAGSGELLLRDGTKVGASGWPRSINWQGKGTATLEVDGGASYVTVRLQ